MKRLLLALAIAAVGLVACVAVFRCVRRDGPATMPLARAAQAGDAAAVGDLVARGEDVNARDENGYTPLAYAARAGDVRVVNALLDAGADANARDCASWGWTPLINALHKYQNAAARTLVERGADVNGRAGECAAAKIENGVTPLMYAAKFDNAEMVKFLLERGADPRARYDGYNALSFAVAGGSLGRLSDIDRAATHPCPAESVKLLLNAAPEERPDAGLVDRAVLYVAGKKCPEVARLLEGRAAAPPREQDSRPAVRN